MSARSFDRKFGAAFLESVPNGPGVYEYWSSDGSLLYVGKAVRLRARLRQYRSATRKKAHRKLRTIVDQAARLTWQATESELAALLLENERIRTYRPPLNVAGAFSFLYPLVGFKRVERELHLVRTTSPEAFEGFLWSGAFRDRALTKAAFDALAALLGEVGHVERSKGSGVAYSRLVRLRQIPSRWEPLLDAFLQGTSRGLLQGLILELVGRPGARRRAEEVQSNLRLLEAFYREEAEVLRDVLQQVSPGERGVAQAERDALFLQAKAR